MTDPTWSVRDYHPFVTGSGAKKLAASQVAPLVAAARGYHTITDPKESAALAESATITGSRRSLAIRLKALVFDDSDDLMVMPWFNLANVTDTPVDAASRVTQIRPSTPQVGEDGKPRKYEFLRGTALELDVHPCTPTDWVSVSPTVLITEGLLKADSALTAQLLDAGNTPADLAAPDTVAEARTRLRELMLAVPAEKRTTIVALGGVTTWHKNPEWSTLKMVDRNVLVAFDGDVTTNPNVWQEAKGLFTFIERKQGMPALLNLNVGDDGNKIGIDDYLAGHGTWADLAALTQTDLPPRPHRASEGVAGDFRVDPERGWVVQELTEVPDHSDPTQKKLAWMDRCEIAGRIVSTETRRRASQQEIDDGVIADNADQESGAPTATVEVSALNGDTPHVFTINGPLPYLAASPADWFRLGAKIPGELVTHGQWPPLSRERKGAHWLAAVKENRREDIRTVRVWDQMGWVPDGAGGAAFIVGGQVLAATSDIAETVTAGVTDSVLPGASNFGVRDTYLTMEYDEWKESFIGAARTIINGYIENGPWTDDAAGVLAVAAMLRPTIPLRPMTVIFVDGIAGSGKSHWSSFVMSGWQETGGTWTDKSLPGSASDSAVAVEDSLSRTPIWIADDLAPDVSRNRQESQESVISAAIRAVHNGSMRRRMDMNTGKQRLVAPPRAVLILTSENGLDAVSIVQRTIPLRMTQDTFADLDRVKAAEKLRDSSDAPASQLVAGMIRYWLDAKRWSGIDNGDSWKARTDWAKGVARTELENVKTMLGHRFNLGASVVARQAEKVADLTLPLTMLKTMLVDLGVPDDDPMMVKLSWREGNYIDVLLQLAADAVRNNRRTTPGRNLVAALSSVLGAGRAHVDNPDNPSAPPMIASGSVTQQNADSVNRALGWRYDHGNDRWVPSGERVGGIINRTTGESSLLFDPRTAFNIAQKHHKDLLPAGQKQSAAWDSAYAEGLCDPAIRRPKEGNAQVRFQHARLRGIPVRLSAIIGGEEDGETDTIEDLETSLEGAAVNRD